MNSEALGKLLEPTVEGLGYELADLELKIGGRDGVLRLFIDKPGGVIGPPVDAKSGTESFQPEGQVILV